MNTKRRPKGRPANNGMQRPALRAAADAGRWTAGVTLSDRRKGVARMGTFYVKCRIENPIDRARSVVLQRSLERIDIPREKKDVTFVLANGHQVTRSVGFAIIRLDKYFTVDEVVFAEPGDLLLLGARTLEGLNLTIDPGRRRLVAAGPLPAASPTSRRLTSALHPTRKKRRAGERRAVSQNRR